MSPRKLTAAAAPPPAQFIKRGAPKLDIEYVRAKLADMDILLLSTEYLNNRQKLDLQCRSCAHVWQTKWGHLVGGHGCPKCANKLKGVYHKLALADVVSAAKVKDIQILGSTYINCDTPIHAKCNTCGYRWTLTAYHLMHDGNGCPSCARRGKNNGAWRGGWRKRDYVGFTEGVKASVRDRDKHTCQFLDCEKVSGVNKLDVHHIDGDKKNYSITNLISLCHAHHSSVEQNGPEEWVEFFRKLTGLVYAC